MITQGIHTHYTARYSRSLMGASKDISNFRTGREIAEFVDTLKNPRESEDSSILDNTTTSMGLRGNTIRMQVRLGVTPTSQRKEHCDAKYSYFKIPYENH